MAKILALIPTIWSVIRSAKNLQGATASSTTAAQWQGNGVVFFVLCVIVVVLGMIPGSPLSDAALQASAVAILTPVLGPLLSRMIRLRGEGVDVLDGPGADGTPSSTPLSVPGPSVDSGVATRSRLWVEHVKTYQQGSWTGWKGTAMDAFYEGWDLGATATGEIWDLHEFRHTGELAVDAGQRERAVKKLREGLAAIEKGEVEG